MPSSRGPICIAAFKIVSCHTLRWWCGPQAGPNARHHNYSQILRVFQKNLLTIPAVLCDNRIIEQLPNRKNLWQHRTIPALRLKHRSGGYGTASALPKCSIMSGCGTRIVLRGQKPLALCDRCPCFGSLFPPLAALTFAASSIICAFGLASAAPRSPYRHLELCGIALCKTRTQHDASPTYFRETLHPVWYPTPPKLNEWPHIPGKIVGAKHSFY